MANNTNSGNRYSYNKNDSCYVSGFIVPKVYIENASLADLERMLGFATGRLKHGAAFAQLNAIPDMHELDYYGDTRTPAHHFEEKRNKQITRGDLSKAAYAYLRSGTILIKVIPLDDPNPTFTDDQNWPPGNGAMQYRLKMNVLKPAFIVDVIDNYPNGRFR